MNISNVIAISSAIFLLHIVNCAISTGHVQTKPRDIPTPQANSVVDINLKDHILNAGSSERSNTKELCNNLTIFKVTEVSLKLVWSEADCPNVSTVYVSAEDKKEPDGTTECDYKAKNLTLTSGTNELEVTGLCPRTQYTTYILDGKQNTVKTLQFHSMPTYSAPSGVRNFAASFLNATAVRLSWKRPLDGPISGYTFFWIGHGNWDLDEKQNSYHIEDLKPNSPYSFSILTYHQPDPSVETTRSRGPGTLLTIQTKYGYPTECRNVKATSLNSSTILVTWKSPMAPNGPIHGYVISFSSSNNDTSKSINLVRGGAHEPGLNVTDLDAYTLYNFQVTAYNNPNDGSEEVLEGDLSETTTARTFPDSKPLNLRASKFGSESLEIEWAETADPIGHIVGYRLNYTILNPKGRNEFLRNRTPTLRIPKSNGTRCSLVRLTPWRKYQITVETVFQDPEDVSKELYGMGAILFSETHIGVPKKPNEVTIKTRSYWSITVSWTPADPITGPNIYLVELDGAPQYITDRFCRIPDEEWNLKVSTGLVDSSMTEDTRYTFQNLQTSRCYRARVIIHNEAGYTFSDYSGYAYLA